MRTSSPWENFAEMKKKRKKDGRPKTEEKRKKLTPPCDMVVLR